MRTYLNCGAMSPPRPVRDLHILTEGRLRLSFEGEQLRPLLGEAYGLLCRIDDAYDKPDWVDRETANTVMDDINDWLGDNAALVALLPAEGRGAFAAASTES